MNKTESKQAGSVRVLFVCLGNICRSPTAEGVFRAQVKKAGLDDRIEIDSAGTGAWHVGNPPDKRATAAAAARGYDLSPLRARQAVSEDFEQFDYVLAMDEDNLHNLKRLKQGGKASPELFLEAYGSLSAREVPDPYYGGDEGFELVLDLIEDAGRGLLRAIQKQL